MTLWCYQTGDGRFTASSTKPILARCATCTVQVMVGLYCKDGILFSKTILENGRSNGSLKDKV